MFASFALFRPSVPFLSLSFLRFSKWFDQQWQLVAGAATIAIGQALRDGVPELIGHNAGSSSKTVFIYRFANIGYQL